MDDGKSQKKTARQARLSRLKSGRSFRLIDLFCGAGGMSLGFSTSFGNPFESIWANDSDAASVATYRANFGAHCVEGNIEELLDGIDLPKADIVIGGPPCQGFSLLNKKRKGDVRRALWQPFLDVVRRSEASCFVMENVPQLIGSPEYAAIVEQARKQGFKCVGFKLLAADYGVPQKRKRAFVVGSRNGDPSDHFPPRKTHFDPSKEYKSLFTELEYSQSVEPWRTVRHAIGDLAPPVGTQIRSVEAPYDLHFGRNPTALSQKRYRAVPDEGMNRFDLQRNAPELTPTCWKRKKSGGTDLFGRMWWDKPSLTIRTEFFKPEKGCYLHPKQHRPITHREAARLQSFPDAFVFCGSKTQIARQIGNAVPPLLADSLAKCCLRLLEDSTIKRSEAGLAQVTPP